MKTISSVGSRAASGQNVRTTMKNDKYQNIRLRTNISKKNTLGVYVCGLGGGRGVGWGALTSYTRANLTLNSDAAPITNMQLKTGAELLTITWLTKTHAVCCRISFS